MGANRGARKRRRLETAIRGVEIGDPIPLWKPEPESKPKSKPHLKIARIRVKPPTPDDAREVMLTLVWCLMFVSFGVAMAIGEFRLEEVRAAHSTELEEVMEGLVIPQYCTLLWAEPHVKIAAHEWGGWWDGEAEIPEECGEEMKLAIVAARQQEVRLKEAAYGREWLTRIVQGEDGGAPETYDPENGGVGTLYPSSHATNKGATIDGSSPR